MLLKSSYDIFGIPLIDTEGAAELILRFVLNLIVVLIIARYIYYKRARRRDFLFTFILISITTFLLCYLLENVKLQLGFALGLFAVFGIIRYRTTTIPIKEMTYLFVLIGISVINALANKKVSYVEVLFTNLVFIGVTWYIEQLRSLENESYTIVLYEKIELVKPNRKEELIADLQDRLGIKISRIEISNIDYQRDTAKIHVYFFKSRQDWKDDQNLDYKTITDEY